MANKVVRVPEGQTDRIDRVLARTLPGLSRRQVQRLLGEGRLRVDGRALRKGEPVRPGAEITIELEEHPAEVATAEQDLELEVLYEDEDLIAVDKPAGRPSHALRASDRGTVANFLAARYPESREASERAGEHGLAHRLDTATSGVIVAARHRQAWSHLRQQFRVREVGKGYLAVVEGQVTASGRIDRPIRSHPRSRRRVEVLAGESDASGAARPAETRYRPVRRLGNATLLEIEIPTGVRHQIRAHLAAIGHPVVGDPLYGAAGGATAGRLLLHAAWIRVRHPRSGQPVRIESPLPADFRAALAAVGPRDP